MKSEKNNFVYPLLILTVIHIGCSKTSELILHNDNAWVNSVASNMPNKNVILSENSSSEWWSVVGESINKSEYEITWQDKIKCYSSSNKAHNLRFNYDEKGFLVKPLKGKNWEVKMLLKAYGKGKLLPVPSGEFQAEKNQGRSENGNLSITYENTPSGMRQNFLVKEKPEGNGKLKLVIQVASSLDFSVHGDGHGISFADSRDQLKYSYEGLKVFDANDNVLKSEMKKEGDGFTIIVSDADASYPILIDPLSTSPDWTSESNQANAWLGRSLASAGDVNGDGFSDIIVGVEQFDNGEIDEGRAYVFLGSITGLSATASWTLESNQAGARFGASVASAGDVNGDGYSDVIIGAPNYDNGVTDEGRAYVYYGSAAGLSVTASWIAESNQSNTFFANSVATAGDVNGDGYSDVIIGANFYDNGETDEGKVFVYSGSATGLSVNPYWVVESNQSGARYGTRVASAGDVNGDGFADVIVGSHLYDNGQTDEGEAFVYYGSYDPAPAPTGLYAIAQDGKVELTWNAVTDPAFLRYNIYQGTSANPTTIVGSTTAIAETSFTVTGLTNGTQYYFRVNSEDNVGHLSYFSNEDAAVPSTKAGNALAFNLSASYVEIPMVYSSTDPTTYELWIKPNSPSRIFGVSGNWGTNWHTNDLTVLDDGTLRYYLWNGGLIYLYSTTSVLDGNWHHVAVVTGTGGTLLYVDGQLEDSDPGVGTTDGGESMRLGAQSTYPGPTVHYYDGAMDEFRIWSSRRSQEEIIAKMFQPARGDETNLFLVYHFDESSGMVAYDGSMFGRDGILYGNPTHVVSGAMAPRSPNGLYAIAQNGKVELTWNAVTDPAFLRYNIYQGTSTNPTTIIGSTNAISETSFTVTGLTNGTQYYFRVNSEDNVGNLSGFSNEDAAVPVLKAGNALHFDGLDDYCNIQDNNLLDLTSTYTLEAWINLEGYSWLAGIISKYHTNSANGYLLRLSGSAPYDEISFDGKETSGLNLQLNKWYHIAAVNNNGSRTLYVNGIEVPLYGTADFTFPTVNTDPLRIGSDYGGRYFTGTIDEVRIWNVARSGSEIVNNYYKPLRGDEAGLIGLWHLDEPAGNIAYDGSKFNLNGTLFNNPAHVVSGAMPENSDTDFLSFSFPELTKPATINYENHTINCEVNYAADRSVLTASFTLSAGASVKIGSTSQTSASTINDFTNPVIYSVTADDGTTVQNWLITVSNAPPPPPPPSVVSFAPVSGPVGTSVVITGTQFDNTPANNIVYFGATKAAITAASETSLTATVPPGATYQPISVLAHNQIGYSRLPFVTTSGGKGISNTTLNTKVDYQTGSGAWWVKLGDLNGDGLTDVVVVNTNGNSISVYRNTSSGTSISVTSKVDYSTGLSPTAVAIADLDGDGKPDLAVSNASSNTVSVFRNTSAGSGLISFAAKVDFTTGSYPHSIVVGDFDLDGRVDIATPNFNANSISLLRNTSSGPGNINYASKVDISTGINPLIITMGDLDGDKKVDLAVTNNNGGSVSVFRNTSLGAGTISYDTKVDFATDTHPWGVSIGDLDGDGKPDLTVANYSNNTVSVFRNTYVNNGVISLAARLDYPTGTTPRNLTMGDIDGDGLVDLTTANEWGNSFSILRNTSPGIGNIGFASKVDYAAGNSTQSVAIGDLNNDGRVDLSVVNRVSNTLSIYRNKSSKTDITSFSFNEQTGPAVFDLNNHTIGIEVNNTADRNALIAKFTLSKGATAKIGSTTQISEITTNNFSNPVTYTITAEDGTTTQNWVVTVTVCVSPATPSINMNNSNPAALILTSSSDTGNQWFRNEVAISGATAKTLTVNQAGTYKVQVTVNGCVSAFSDEACILSKPTVTANNSNPATPILTSSSETGNQWFRNDVAINGATAKTLTVKQAGTYTVQVTINGCVSPFSEGLPYVITGLEPPISSSIGIYPNPAYDELTIDLTAFEFDKVVIISIKDILGKPVSETTGQGGKTIQVDIRNFSNGPYLLLLQQGQNIVYKKFIKTL